MLRTGDRDRDDSAAVVTDEDPASAAALPPPAPGVASTRGTFANAVGKLSAVNVVTLLCAFITGPITARALGVDGRGQLAAIIAVLTLGPWLLDFGMGQWLARERARGGDRERLLGTALPVVIGVSLISLVVALPLSHAIGAGRPVVITVLQIGMFLMPISVVLFALGGLAVGEARWGLYSAARLVGAILPVVVLVPLAAAGSLTVALAAGCYLIGGLLGSLLLLRTVQGVRRLTFSLRRSAAAAKFGAQCWLGQVAGTASNRLDQVLLAALASSRELGLYAVAVTIASLAYGPIQAVSAALFPRVAEGDPGLASRACRITALVVAILAVVLGAIAPAMIPFVFGEDYRAAVPMVLILLVASIASAISVVLSAALVAVNEPVATMRAELAALAVSIPALIAFLPGFGGRAAALISVMAYTVRVALQLAAAQRAFSTPVRSFLLPTGADFRWLLAQTRRGGART